MKLNKKADILASSNLSIGEILDILESDIDNLNSEQRKEMIALLFTEIKADENNIEKRIVDIEKRIVMKV